MPLSLHKAFSWVCSWPGRPGCHHELWLCWRWKTASFLKSLLLIKHVMQSWPEIKSVLRENLNPHKKSSPMQKLPFSLRALLSPFYPLWWLMLVDISIPNLFVFGTQEAAWTSSIACITFNAGGCCIKNLSGCYRLSYLYPLYTENLLKPACWSS